MRWIVFVSQILLGQYFFELSFGRNALLSSRELIKADVTSCVPRKRLLRQHG